jgi:superfamily I DNA/RNA helicase
MRQVGHRYRHRLDQPRLRSHEVAARLDIDPIVVSDGLPRPKRLAPGWLANHVLRAIDRFCQTADEKPGVEHFPRVDGIDLPDPITGKQTYRNADQIALELEGALAKAWQDLSHTEGALRFVHDHYLKLWALGHPQIDADYLLLDEAQDTNPVLAGVLAEQECQVIYVGDENQQLYAWRGAIDAMAEFPAENRSTLTRTFRFGWAIADCANDVLDQLEAPLRIEANEEQFSTVGAWDGPIDAYLCRTNATAISAVLAAQMRGQRVHLVGGGTEVARFARAVRELKETGHTSHHDLACFDSWAEVKSYVADDPSASEMRLMVRLIEEFGIETILRAVDGTTHEGPGVLTVSTGHKAKGRQWDVVRVAGDFAEVEATPPELRLRYVAFTRAKVHLDHTAFRDLQEPVLASDRPEG